MSPNQTGVFYTNAMAQGAMAAFPRQYRRQLGRLFDGRFTLLLTACVLLIGGPILLLSYRQPAESLSDKDIRRIQERYAQLVLNQPRVQEPEAAGPVRETAAEAASKKKREEEVDRSRESVVDKQERRERTREERQARRDRISQEVGSAGIFAAITAVSGSGGAIASQGVSDLLGAAHAVGGLERVPVTGGAFATRHVDPATLTGRRGERTTGVGIERSEVGRVEATRIASAGSVNITSEPPALSGDAGQVQTSQACIQRVITREQARIKRVYETWLKREPQLGGRIRVRFTILADGTVSNVMLIQSTTNNSRFDANITRYIAQWVFTACAIGSPLEVELPFAFTGDG